MEIKEGEEMSKGINRKEKKKGKQQVQRKRRRQEVIVWREKCDKEGKKRRKRVNDE